MRRKEDHSHSSLPHYYTLRRRRKSSQWAVIGRQSRSIGWSVRRAEDRLQHTYKHVKNVELPEGKTATVKKVIFNKKSSFYRRIVLLQLIV